MFGSDKSAGVAICSVLVGGVDNFISLDLFFALGTELGESESGLDPESIFSQK